MGKLLSLLTLSSLSKPELTFWLGTSEIALFLGSAVIVIGLLGEYAKAARWQPWLRTFEVLVVIGVTAEMVADAGIFVLSARLQRVQDKAVTQAQKESSKALLEAGKLRTELAQAEEGTAEAQARASEANEKAEAEHLARVKIEERLVSRNLSRDWKLISERLAPLPKQHAIIIAEPMIMDSWLVAEHLHGILAGIGWDVPPPSDTRLLCEGEGITLWVRPGMPPETLEAAIALHKVMNEQGFKATLRVEKSPCLMPPEARLVPDSALGSQQLVIDIF